MLCQADVAKSCDRACRLDPDRRVVRMEEQEEGSSPHPLTQTASLEQKEILKIYMTNPIDKEIIIK